MKMQAKIFISALTLMALMSLSSCSTLYLTGRLGTRSYSTATEGIRVACVGDSITYGFGISNWPENNYPAVLHRLLGDGYIVNNYGVNGCTVQADANKPYAQRKEYRDSVEFDPDIVVFMLGSNDSKTFNWKNSEEFRRQYLSLIESYSNSRLILCTVAKAFYSDGKTGTVTNYSIQPEVVDEISGIIREIAEEKNLPLIDVNALTAPHPEWYTSDFVHLNAEGAKAIAEAVFDMLQ